MPALYSVQVRTHTGSVRDINEDTVSSALDWRAELSLSDEDLRLRGHLFAVADGMGGHAAGEVASALAIETLFTTYYTGPWTTADEALTAAIAAANAALCAEAEARSDYEGMGTTLVAALLSEAELTIANVGDSRAYLFRRGVIQQITRDHSWVEEQIAAGVLDSEDAARHPYRNVITRSLGPDREPGPDIFKLDVTPGDRILLCSDGLSNLVTDAELAQFLSSYPADEVADILIEQALERGAPDNVSLALVEYLGQTARVHRQLWPWIALVLFILVVLAFLFRDQWFSPVLPPTPSVVALQPAPTPTLTPTPAATEAPAFVSPLESPLATPTSLFLGEAISVAAIEMSPAGGASPTPDLVERFGPLGAAGNSQRRYPPRDLYVYYIEGAADYDMNNSQRPHLLITHQSAEGDEFTYVAPLDLNALYDSALPPSGSRLGVIARPASEDVNGNETLLEPLLVLDRFTQDGVGRPVWVQGGDLQTILDSLSRQWVFSVHGPGGGDGLGLHGALGQVGRPIVLWGGWQALAETPRLVEFVLLDAEPYEYDGEVYRQPGSGAD